MSGNPATIRWLSDFGREVIQAARMLRRSKVFPLLSIATLAIGMGSATAMISVLNGTLWHPLPFPDPDRLVLIRGAISYPTLLEWSSSARSMEGIAGYRSKRYTLTGTGEATSLKAIVSSGSLFPVLRARAALGRTFTPGDDHADFSPVVLSDSAWRSVFARDPEIIGRTIYLNRAPFVVVGVMPSGFQFPSNVDRIDLYTTVAADLRVDRRQAERSYPRDLQSIARLKPGVLLPQAQAEIYTKVAATASERRDRNINRAGLVVPLAEEISGSLAGPLKILSYAVGCVLAISCVTVAILSLIRVHSRQIELATRLALGATRAHIAQQLLAESLLISLAGSVVGTILAALSTGAILAAAWPAVEAAARVQFDFRVVGIALLASLAIAAGFGVIPALHGAATRWPNAAIRRDARRGSMASGVRWFLVITEIALTVVLLAASISLLRSYLILSHVDVGFDPTRVLTFRIDLSDAVCSTQQQVDFFHSVRTRVETIPGVESAAFTALLPFGDLRFTIRLPAPKGGSAEGKWGAEVNLVSPGFFKAMGIPISEGRDFTSEDMPDHPRVAIISRSLANRYFYGESPIGRSLEAGFGPGADSNPMVQIVGVAGDVHNGTLAAPADPQLYVPFSQAPMIASTTFVARLDQADAGPAVTAIRQHVRALNPAIPVVNIKPLGEYVAGSLQQPRFNALLISLFTATAIFLAMTGLYAVVSYAVQHRRREFSIRRALGATERGIAWLVLKQCLAVIAPGAALGIAGAAATNQLMQTVLFGVRAGSPGTLLLAAAIAAASSLLAAWKPALAAGSDDLRVTLQSE
jgi:putative ABC transport system permease protein